MMNLSVHEHGLSSHLFISLTSLRVLFSSDKSCTYLYFATFIFKFLGVIFFGGCHSNWFWLLLLVYTKAVDFYTLTVPCNLAILAYLFRESFCRFFVMFYIDTYATCKEKQFYFLISFLCTFKFLPHWRTIPAKTWSAIFA